MNINNKITEDKEEIANAFNEHFVEKIRVLKDNIDPTMKEDPLCKLKKHRKTTIMTSLLLVKHMLCIQNSSWVLLFVYTLYLIMIIITIKMIIFEPQSSIPVLTGLVFLVKHNNSRRSGLNNMVGSLDDQQFTHVFFIMKKTGI